MPTPSQFRAARALLNLKQQDVSDGTGIGLMTISDLENERSQPKAGTVDAVTKFYGSRGIDFTLDGGMRISSNTVQIFDGPDCYLNFLNEVQGYLVLLRGEILFSGADERRSPPAIVEKLRSFINDGIGMRSLIRPGDDYVMGDTAQYRWMPEDLFVEGDVKVICGDRVAWLVSWLTNPRVIMIKDPLIAQEAKRVFDFFWKMSQGPETSSAPEKY